MCGCGWGTGWDHDFTQHKVVLRTEGDVNCDLSVDRVFIYTKAISMPTHPLPPTRVTRGI